MAMDKAPEEMMGVGEEHVEADFQEGGEERAPMVMWLTTNSEGLATEHAVFGRYEETGVEEGKPVFMGPEADGAHARIAFQPSEEEASKWVIFDAAGVVCFCAEDAGEFPPQTGWRREFDDEDLDMTLEFQGEQGEWEGGTACDGYGGGEPAVLCLTTTSQELEMEHAVFGLYEESGVQEGRPTFAGPEADEGRATIVFEAREDGTPAWWVRDASGVACFLAESEAPLPPSTGWRKEFEDEELDICLEIHGHAAEGGEEEPADATDEHPGAREAAEGARDRSRSPMRAKHDHLEAEETEAPGQAASA